MSESTAVRPPVQDRGRRTQERIVRAAETILSEDGPAAVTVKAVMARAGVGPGSFYARFSGLDALFVHIQERAWTRLEDEVRALESWESWSEVPVGTRAAELVRRLVRAHSAHEATLRALMAQAIRRPAGPAMERLVALHESLMEVALERLQLRGQEDEGAMRVALLQVLGALRSLILFPDENPLDAGRTEEDLILALTRTVLSGMGEAVQAPPDYQGLLRASASIRSSKPIRRKDGAPEFGAPS